MPKTPVYTAGGRVVGYTDGDRYVTNRRASIHQLRQPRAWAVDKSILDGLRRDGIQRVIIHETEGGITYSAPLEAFYKHPIAISRGHGAQVALALEWWECDGRKAEAEKQAEQQTAKQAQLSLFGADV